MNQKEELLKDLDACIDGIEFYVGDDELDSHLDKVMNLISTIRKIIDQLNDLESYGKRGNEFDKIDIDRFEIEKFEL